MCNGCSVLCDILVVTRGKKNNCSCSSLLILCVHDCVLQVHINDVPGAPRGDLHHSRRGPLASHADPQQVSHPPAAKGNSQRFGLRTGHSVVPLACPPPSSPQRTASLLLQKPRGRRSTVALCLPIPPCTTSSTTTFPLSPSADRETCCPPCF